MVGTTVEPRAPARARLRAAALASALLALGACAARPPAATAGGGMVTVRTDWAPPPGATPAALSATPGRYDFGDYRYVVDGKPTSAGSGLAALADNFALVLGQIPAEAEPLGGSARIVLPDHDRLRVLVAPPIRQRSPGATEFLAEERRLAAHEVADAVLYSRVFSSVSLVEQNDTVAPELDGADTLIWYQIRSLGGNDGPWVGQWKMRRAGGSAISDLAFDAGSPPGPQRLISFVKAIRFAAAHPGAAAPAFAGAPPSPASNGVRRAASSGTGIVIDGQGRVLTDNHVIANCPDLRLRGGEEPDATATVVAADAANDLALLKADRRYPAFARFRDSRGLRPGEPVVVTGFPLAGLVSPEMAVTTGSLTVLGGPRGDERVFQFSAPVQPGNSGGPVMDESGRVIGVAKSVLGLGVAMLTGLAPQNVNFATKTEIASAFLSANQAPVAEAPGRAAMSPAEIGDLARRFTLRVECWR